ncbi:cytoplasmic protein [Neptuniibacter sp.]|uniref:cytoplasmic protein n=1 Tax=Neptuniibacter sp. TaxID=1962643 RepID=UPI003B5B9A99
MNPDIERARRESIRWLILLALNNARPIGAGERLILTIAQAEYPDVTEHEMRRELDYLEDRKLVDINKKPSGQWHAELTRCGTDIAEYTIDCGPGIARPEKYW